MRNLLALFGAVLLAFAGIGWYLGWYQFKTEPELSGHQNVNIDINAPKIMADVKKGRNLVEKLKQEAETAPSPAPLAPASVPPQP